jgi:1-phosphofructokinase family hexose kinase
MLSWNAQLDTLSPTGQEIMTAAQVVCVSANPAIDRRIHLTSLALGRISRAISAEPAPGGKAAHVAMAAHALGAQTVWLGFLGGATGEEFATGFRKLGIGFVAVRTAKPTRTNLELLESSGRITEVLEPGEAPRKTERDEMLAKLRSGLERKWRNAAVVISGSLPSGLAPSFYSALIRAAKASGSRVFLDTSGDALCVGLRAGPAFVKPNLEEAEKLLRRRLSNRQAVIDAAHELIRRGAESAGISLGAEGLIWVERLRGRVWFARPPRVKEISSVGSGDATVAGFAVAAMKGLSGEKALRLAVACGAANCLAASPGQISHKQVSALMSRVEIRTVG